MHKILAPLLALTIALGVGCERKSAIQADALPLDAQFPTNTATAANGTGPSSQTPAESSLPQQVAAVRQEMQSGNYGGAATRLRQIELSGKLNGPQLQAVHETTVIIQQRLAERAATGDPEAKRAWEEYQKSLTR